MASELDAKPPMEIDPAGIYRVWYDDPKTGEPKKLMGRVKFVRDGNGWGLTIYQDGDTTRYFAPGSYRQIAESWRSE